MRQGLGVWGCTQVSEAGDDSPAGVGASQYFSDQHGCYQCKQTGYQWLTWELLLPRVPVEGDWCRSWLGDPSALHVACTVGTELSLPSWPWAEVLEALGIPHSGLLKAGCGLLAHRHRPGAAWGSCCRLVPTDFYARQGWVSPCGFDRGGYSLSLGVIPPKKPHHCMGYRTKKRLFFMYPPF